MAVPLFNLTDVVARRIAYPRAQRMVILERELSGAALVVIPGQNEPDVLLKIAPWNDPGRIVALTTVAKTSDFERGTALLSERIESVLEEGGRVELVDLFDVPPRSNPWKFLGRLGYDLAGVQHLLARFPLSAQVRHRPPFTFRAIAVVDAAGSQHVAVGEAGARRRAAIVGAAGVGVVVHPTESGPIAALWDPRHQIPIRRERGRASGALPR